jgi:hypothetical protein
MLKRATVSFTFASIGTFHISLFTNRYFVLQILPLPQNLLRVINSPKRVSNNDLTLAASYKPFIFSTPHWCQRSDGGWYADCHKARRARRQRQTHRRLPR